MATISYKIFLHHKKEDGTYNIKYPLTHLSKTKYISSRFHVNDSQIKKVKVKRINKKTNEIKESVDIVIRDVSVLGKVNSDLEKYRTKIEDIGISIKNMSVSDVKNILEQDDAPVSIDFVTFYREYLESLLEQQKRGQHRSLRSPFNHLIDFVDKIDANDVDSVFLKSFELHLRKEKTLVRKNAGKQDHLINSSLDDAGVFKVMEGIRNIHNKCKDKYNSERNEVITSDPFKYYKMPRYKMKRKDMDKDLVSKIVAYRDMELQGRKQLARDISMLSLYLCGMNAKDMYDGNYVIKDGRIEYERAKTSSRRTDNAFISVKITKESKPLLEKYTPEYLQNRYASHEGFTSALSAGHKGSGFTFYDFRDAFTSIAINICGFPDNAVEAAINHFDESKVINRYKARDWSVIDRVQEAVINKINEDLK